MCIQDFPPVRNFDPAPLDLKHINTVMPTTLNIPRGFLVISHNKNDRRHRAKH
jgi:hypothetical protein